MELNLSFQVIGQKTPFAMGGTAGQAKLIEPSGGGLDIYGGGGAVHASYGRELNTCIPNRFDPFQSFPKPRGTLCKLTKGEELSGELHNQF